MDLLFWFTLQIGCPRPLDGIGSEANVSFKLSQNFGNTISKVGPINISEESLISVFRKQPLHVQQKILKDEIEGKKFLKTQITRELLFLKAIKRGMLNDADVQNSLKKILLQKIAKVEFNDNKTRRVFSDQEVRKYYNEHIDRFRQARTLVFGE